MTTDYVRMAEWNPRAPKWRVFKDRSELIEPEYRKWCVITPRQMTYAACKTWSEAMDTARAAARRGPP